MIWCSHNGHFLVKCVMAFGSVSIFGCFFFSTTCLPSFFAFGLKRSFTDLRESNALGTSITIFVSSAFLFSFGYPPMFSLWRTLSTLAWYLFLFLYTIWLLLFYLISLQYWVLVRCSYRLFFPCGTPQNGHLSFFFAIRSYCSIAHICGRYFSALVSVICMHSCLKFANIPWQWKH